jgi:hypothetical protein
MDICERLVLIMPKIVLSKNINDEPVYAYEIEGTEIYNCETSECGRFAVNPLEHYKLTQEEVTLLNDLNDSQGYDYTV